VKKVSQIPTDSRRIYALDALRASVMILGVFLHGAVAYMHTPMPGLVWPVSDPSSGWFFDAVLWYLHGFRIPLFFIASGFFAALLCEIWGADKYLVHRLKRIAVPLLAAALFILPGSYYLWGFGLSEQGIVTWREVWRMSFHGNPVKEEILGLAHLWFLQYLLIYSLLYYLLRRGFPGLFNYPKRVRLLENGWWPLSLLIVVFPMLWLHPDIFMVFDNRWWPEPWEFTYYALFFAVGSIMNRVKEQLSRLVTLGPYYIVASLVVFAFAFSLLKAQLEGVSSTAGTGWFFALATALYSCLAVWGFLGIFLRYFANPSNRVRFVSDAAYWIYLVHLPLIVMAQ